MNAMDGTNRMRRPVKAHRAAIDQLVRDAA
jgi:hypothetical protein